MKLVVTGCGRSGTQFMAAVLGHLGLKVSHERCFKEDSEYKTWEEIAEAKEWKDYDAECSWLAAPFVDILPPGTIAIHLVRDLLKVVRCWYSHDIITTAPVGAFARKYVEYEEDWTPLKKAIYYVYDWNELMDSHVGEGIATRVKVEDITPVFLQELFYHCGFPFEMKKAEQALDGITIPFNHAGCGSHKVLTWEDIVREEDDVGRCLRGMSIRYGYPP